MLSLIKTLAWVFAVMAGFGLLLRSLVRRAERPRQLLEAWARHYGHEILSAKLDPWWMAGESVLFVYEVKLRLADGSEAGASVYCGTFDGPARDYRELHVDWHEESR